MPRAPSAIAACTEGAKRVVTLWLVACPVLYVVVRPEHGTGALRSSMRAIVATSSACRRCSRMDPHRCPPTRTHTHTRKHARTHAQTRARARTHVPIDARAHCHALLAPAERQCVRVSRAAAALLCHAGACPPLRAHALRSACRNAPLKAAPPPIANARSGINAERARAHASPSRAGRPLAAKRRPRPLAQ